MRKNIITLASSAAVALLALTGLQGSAQAYGYRDHEYRVRDRDRDHDRVIHHRYFSHYRDHDRR